MTEVSILLTSSLKEKDLAKVLKEIKNFNLPFYLWSDYPLSGFDWPGINLLDLKGKRGEVIVELAKNLENNGCLLVLPLEPGLDFKINFFLDMIKNNPQTLICGVSDINSLSTSFWLKFSGFWFFLETGQKFKGGLSPARVYPLALLNTLKVFSKGLAFESEVMVKAAWSGFKIKEIVLPGFKLSMPTFFGNFFGFLNVHLALFFLHTRLVIRALIPVPYRELVLEKPKNLKLTVLKPQQSLKKLLVDKETPARLFLTSLISIFISLFPIFGFQSVSLLFLCSLWHLNRPWALAISHVAFPGLLPFFCLEIGHFVRFGEWLTTVPDQIFKSDMAQWFWDWMVGVFSGGVLLALFISFLVYFLAKVLRHYLDQNS